MKYSPRFWAPVCFVAILLLLVLPRKPMVAAGNHVVLIMGGDVEWSLNSRPPTGRYPVVDPRPFGFLVFGKRDVRDQVIGDWPPIPYVNEGESKTYLESLGLKGGSDDSFGESLSYPLQTSPEYTQDYSSNEELLSYPLGRTGQPYDPKLFQLFLMEGSSAQQLLESIRSRSAALDTAMEIDGNRGIITIPPAGK